MQLKCGVAICIMMRGLETDKIIDNLYLGSMGDASHLPFRAKHGITALCNVAI